MKPRTIGKTGLSVFTVGFGTGMLGVKSFGDTLQVYNNKFHLIDEGFGMEALTVGLEGMIEKAKERGFKAGEVHILIDTAALYGDRHSEKIIGQVLRRHPEFKPWVLVTTKVGQTYGKIDYSPEAILTSLSISQELTGIDRFRVVYLHDPMGLPEKEVIRARETLIRADVIDHIGLAANDPNTTKMYLQRGLFPVAVIPECTSLINRRVEQNIIPLAKQYGTALIAATVIEKGLLTDSPLPETIPLLNRHFTPECIAHVTRLRNICHSFDSSLNAVAMQWPSHQYQNVSCSIIGIDSPAQAEALVKAAWETITEECWKEIGENIQHFIGQRTIWSPKETRRE